MIQHRIDTLQRLYRQHGRKCYGEAVSQIDHAVQAATLARQAGHGEDIILAAFLHDLGHLLEEEGLEPMGDYGMTAHDRLGADMLGEMGFSKGVCRLVRLHVQAKRYLCSREPGYERTLSAASRATLALQGGPMGQREADDFARQPDLPAILAIRRLDEAAKDGGWSLEDADWIWPMMRDHLQREAACAVS